MPATATKAVYRYTFKQICTTLAIDAPLAGGDHVRSPPVRFKKGWYSGSCRHTGIMARGHRARSRMYGPCRRAATKVMLAEPASMAVGVRAVQRPIDVPKPGLAPELQSHASRPGYLIHCPRRLLQPAHLNSSYRHTGTDRSSHARTSLARSNKVARNCQPLT